MEEGGIVTTQFDKILISHAHHDQHYVKQLVDLIKVVGVTDILCSSYRGHGIPQDKNIYDYLKESILEHVWVIFVLSKNYYQSAACLNEMGATWVLGQKYTTILLPNYDFSSIKGAIDPSRVSFKLNNRAGLNELKNNLVQHFELQRPEDNIWESARDEVIQKINSYAEEERKRDVPARAEAVEIIPSFDASTDGSTFTAVLRLINDNEYPVIFYQIKLTLVDEHHNHIEFVIAPNEILYNKENKLIRFPAALPEGKYNPLYHASSKIEWVVKRKIF